MKLTTKKSKVLGLAILTSLLAFVLIFCQGSMAYREKEAPIDFANEVPQNENVTFFSESVQPRWFVYGAPIYYAYEDNYSDLSLTPKYKDYNTNPSIAAEPAINSEIYFLYATDSTGTEVKLKPVEGNNVNTNQTAANNVKVKFKYEIELWTKLYFANDDRTLGNLDSNLYIPGSKIKVGKGKILYRTVSLSTTSFKGTDWNFIDLADGAELSFDTPEHIQISVIYEIREEGKNIFQRKWHHCVANYIFSVDKH